MKFTTNAKHNVPPEDGTIFTCNFNTLRISIHRYAHCDGWYLSCPDIQISSKSLKSEALADAIQEGIREVIKTMEQKIEKMQADIEKIKAENVEISR